MNDSDRTAVTIYGVAGRDPTDAIDMILECEDLRALETLLKMLTSAGSARTDHALNKILAGPCERRLTALRGAV